MPGLIALSTSDSRLTGKRLHSATRRRHLRTRCNSAPLTSRRRPRLTPESGRCRSERRVVSMAPAQAASYVQQIPGLGLAGHLNRDALADAKPLAAAIRRWPQQSTDYRIRSPRPGGCTRLARPHRTSSGQVPQVLGSVAILGRAGRRPPTPRSGSAAMPWCPRLSAWETCSARNVSGGAIGGRIGPRRFGGSAAPHNCCS